MSTVYAGRVEQTLAVECACGAIIAMPVILNHGSVDSAQYALWDHILDAHPGCEESYTRFTSRNGVRIDLMSR